MVRSVVGLVCGLLLLPALALASASEQDRRIYLAADSALKSRNWSSFEPLRAQLQDYPLAIYLDYGLISAQLQQVNAPAALEFSRASAGTPLQLRFKDRVLRSMGKDRRWSDFLKVSDELPKETLLQCYFYRAKLAAGDADDAWRGAGQLWVHGDSRPRQCDPLFAAWMDAGELSDAIMWQRMLAAFDSGRRNLMTYAARRASPDLKPWADTLEKIYRDPARLSTQSAPSQLDSRSADLFVHGLPRLARKNPGSALDLWEKAAKVYPFTDQQGEKVGDAIAWQSLFQSAESNYPWVDNYLAIRRHDKLTEQRLRTTLKTSDWAGLLNIYPHLSVERQQAPVWRYWSAQAMQALGRTEEADRLWQTLAGERDYYGFLAAGKVARDYELNHQPLPVRPSPPQLLEHAGLARATELMHHGEVMLAQSEWSYLLPGLSVAEQESLALHASQQGWHRLAIDAVTRAKAWDRLELRFPMAYESTFDHYARLRKITSTELISIARRESALFPLARSSAGARGLMQLMPATARDVARGLGQPQLNQDLYDINANIALGSAYYKQLLEKYAHNRVFTLAAYNAGPHRVTRWRKENSDTLSVEQWIETIPFRETRNYVQAVLAYNVVYNGLRQHPVTLLTETEVKAVY